MLADPIPKTLGRYELIEEIGRGMMGVVYRAQDPALGRTVALKTVRLAFSVPEDERTHFEKRFLAEARVAAGLSHPGIVVVHDVGRDEASGTLFIALEHLQGRTLAELGVEGHPLEWREALRLVARVAEALDVAHRQGVVHRDIKPANIMVLPNGDPKIMDFGIAKVPTAQLTAAGEFFGTPLYMSPEQAQGEAVDGRSDIFSLGAVLYLLLTGQRAFDAPSVPAILSRVTTQEPAAPSGFVDGLPKDADYVVARALAKNPADRYPDARSMAEDLSDVLEARVPRHRGSWTRRADGTWLAVPLEALEPTPEGAVAGEPAVARATASLRSTRPPADEASLVLRLADRMGTRGLLVLAGLLALGMLLAMLLPRPGSAPSSSSDAVAQQPATPEKPGLLGGLFRSPAHLEVTFEHSLRSGTLRVFVDDELVLDEPLESRVTKRLILKQRRGSEKEVIDVKPGEHQVRVEVQGDEERWAKRIRGSFESGVTRSLGARLGGLIRKDLVLWWND